MYSEINFMLTSCPIVDFTFKRELAYLMQLLIMLVLPTPAKPMIIRSTNTKAMSVRAQIGVNNEQTAVTNMAPVRMCFAPNISASVPAGIWVKNEP